MLTSDEDCPPQFRLVCGGGRNPFTSKLGTIFSCLIATRRAEGG